MPREIWPWYPRFIFQITNDFPVKKLETQAINQIKKEKKKPKRIVL